VVLKLSTLTEVGFYNLHAIALDIIQDSPVDATTWRDLSASNQQTAPVRITDRMLPNDASLIFFICCMHQAID